MYSCNSSFKHIFVGRKDFGDKGVHVPDITLLVTFVTQPTPEAAVGTSDGSKVSSLNVDDLIVIKSSFECKYLITL